VNHSTLYKITKFWAAVITDDFSSMAQIHFLAGGGISLFATTIRKILGNIRDKVGDGYTWHLLLLVKSVRLQWTRHHMENNMPEIIFVGKLFIERPLGIQKGTNDKIS
jgi:hypothetical protein